MINAKLRDAMNEHVKNELHSSYLYLSMAFWLHGQGLDGMAHWMRVQAHEEWTHGMKFMDHITDRGGKVELIAIPAPKASWASVKAVWDEVCTHEAFVSSRINALLAIARQENEFSSEPMLAWFVREQVEEEATAGKIAQQVGLVGPGQGLLLMDRELAARPFAAGSAFNPAVYNAPAAGGAP